MMFIMGDCHVLYESWILSSCRVLITLIKVTTPRRKLLRQVFKRCYLLHPYIRFEMPTRFSRHILSSTATIQPYSIHLPHNLQSYHPLPTSVLSKTNLGSLSGLLSTALLPALQIKQSTSLTFPREFLDLNSHIIRHGTVPTVRMRHKQHILNNRKDAHRCSHHRRNLYPLPHLGELLLGGVFGGFHDFLLATDTCTEVGDGLGLHLCLGAETGDGLVGAALDGLGALTGGCSSEGACSKHGFNSSMLLQR
mmetsp:Transcript_3736/g.5392  ORF Transcript_3736/g.5392 Transcript_3736/m.5392 type:complete len:251 (-) Transcript_3736:28-780(-)